MVPSESFARVVRAIDPRDTLVRAWPLDGGSSAEITALEVARADAATETLVVRRHGARDLAADPRVAFKEHRLLDILHAAGVAVPRPRHLDESRAILPTPYLVVDYIAGAPDIRPADAFRRVREFAQHLASIHAVDVATHDVSFLADQDARFAALIAADAAPADAAWDTAPARAVLRRLWPPPRRNAPVVLHGDYWPGNALWRDGRLVAVIDWEDAALGDPLADVANARLEILWAFGADAMAAFTAAYRATMPNVDATDLPAWDLCADLRLAPRVARWGLDALTAAAMAECRASFVAAALAGLPTR